MATATTTKHQSSPRTVITVSAPDNAETMGAEKIAGEMPPSIDEAPIIARVASERIGGERVSIESVSREAIAFRAWELWQLEGCPNGCELEHWLRAEQELVSAENA